MELYANSQFDETTNLLEELSGEDLWVKVRLKRRGRYWIRVVSMEGTVAVVNCVYPFVEDQFYADYQYHVMNKTYSLPVDDIIVLAPLQIRSDEELFDPDRSLE